MNFFSQEWINSILWNNSQLDQDDRLDEIRDKIAEARSIAGALRENGDKKTANDLEGLAARIENTYLDFPQPMVITLGDFVTCPDGMTGMVMGIDGDRLLVRFLDGCRPFPAANCTLVEVDL